MQNEIARLIVSINAGLGETYNAINGVVCFEKVIENLRKYQEAAVGMVVPKCVIIPEVNDDEMNIDSFCAIIV